MTKAMKNRAYQELKSNAGILEKRRGIAACQTDKQGKGIHEKTDSQMDFQVLF